MGKIIGIDLGTTKSCVSVMEGGETIIIPNSEGLRTTPSVVAFLDNGEIKVGDPAKHQATTNPQKTVASIKRFMGRIYSEISGELARVPYQVTHNDDNDTPRVKIGDKLYSPQEISAMTLRKMKKTAEDYLGYEVTSAVITVPAYFNVAQRQATKEAGEIAGLKVEHIINEPTAAALAYGLDKKGTINIAVFDLGGGTLDISIIVFDEGVFEVYSTNGDTHLGGDNFDEKIISWLISEFKSEGGTDLGKDPMALQRLKEAAEKAKIELSSSLETEINLPYITAIDGVPKNLVRKLSRAKFEQLCDDLICRTLELCKKALSDARSRISISSIDEVILVGGSTRIPKIQEIVEQFFGKKPAQGVNPDEVVAVGASIQGAVLSGDVTDVDVYLLDVMPISLGISTQGGAFTHLIKSNTIIPERNSLVVTTYTDNQRALGIDVFQGEQAIADANKTIGHFELCDIPPLPRGVPEIEVTFDIDANGILNISAKDKTNGKDQKIRIQCPDPAHKRYIA